MNLDSVYALTEAENTTYCVNVRIEVKEQKNEKEREKSHFASRSEFFSWYMTLSRKWDDFGCNEN